MRFCQEVHSETLERLREKSIGALTLLAFLDKYEWVESDIGELVCLHCDGVRPYHTPECLLNTILEVYRAYET